MPHRFTEPTPTSQAGFHTVEVFVASWEIECCAPPPEVGALSTWVLEFISADQYPNPDLDHENTWRAAPWPPMPCPPEMTRLSDGPIAACWSRSDIDVGAMRLRGRLSGTVHVVPSGFPRTTGRVDRLRMVTQQYAFVAAERCWTPVPGTMTFTDIPHSPRWFDHPAAPPVDGGTRICQTGVLLDLAVSDAAEQDRRVPTHIALIGGDNLGGDNRVAMPGLRARATGPLAATGSVTVRGWLGVMKLLVLCEF